MIIYWKAFGLDSFHFVAFRCAVDGLGQVLVESRGKILPLCLLACVPCVPESSICNLLSLRLRTWDPPAQATDQALSLSHI